jgi:hypothetical protein
LGEKYEKGRDKGGNARQKGRRVGKTKEKCKKKK